MYSPTPDILYFSTKNKIEVFKPHELETIKSGTLRILSEVGVYFPQQKSPLDLRRSRR